ncbi:NAD(P)H-dependent glycerol-3-phosphate dehydrogenase [Rothia nasimurium]|uniref:NAD(P)H-dependent glycerol-3-phosphate dehydrogenase n=1 Tax=Rothia nasimurium TaxID=85336 RepID=UPI001F269A9B|nr:NAD(P)H-dependent glycerol-3-phosphate dehydrogenase [Rothia nasimurium]
MTNVKHQKIAVLGAGSWGTAFAKVLADAAASSGADRQVVLWGRNPTTMEAMQQSRTNEGYFPGVKLPDSMVMTADAAEALTGASIVVLAIPAQVLRSQLEVFAPLMEEDALLVSLAKGLEMGTGLRMSEVMIEVLQGHLIASGAAPETVEAVPGRVTVLSGPNLAKEIIAEQPTTSVVAAQSEQTAQAVAAICAADYFRPYTNTDIVGVEIGGLVKNVIALCVGMCEGKQYGDNSKASVMTRGLAETTRLALALGGKSETMSGLAGMGDLIATCASPLSRNHTAGRLLAEGIAPDQLHTVMTQTAESIKSAPVVAELARKVGVEMPITEAVTAVLDRRISVEELAPALLGRSLKSEESTPAAG